MLLTFFSPRLLWNGDKHRFSHGFWNVFFILNPVWNTSYLFYHELACRFIPLHNNYTLSSSLPLFILLTAFSISLLKIVDPLMPASHWSHLARLSFPFNSIKSSSHILRVIRESISTFSLSYFLINLLAGLLLPFTSLIFSCITRELLNSNC